MPDIPPPRLRVLNLMLGGRAGGPNYSVSFQTAAATWRPLSVIAGESQTGKTSTVEFILYCLGGRSFPEHPEVAGAVRSASLEAVMSGDLVVIERSASMQASATASFRRSSLDGAVIEERLHVEPPSDPSGLSQKVLEAFDLAGVALPLAPTQEESEVDTLSIRDVMRVMWLPNERLDSKNLLFEHGNHVVTRKFRQTIDAIFDVDDAAGAALAANLRLARQDLREAEGAARTVQAVVASEYPEGVTALELEVDDAGTRLSGLRAALHSADHDVQVQNQTVSQLKKQLRDAQTFATQTALRVRNRRSLLMRLVSLRSQYIDDQKKLIFLNEADRLFDPLQVTVCPACFSDLKQLPSVANDHCTLCGQLVTSPEDTHTIESNRTALVDELRAAKRRLTELQTYIGRLEADLAELESIDRRAVEAYEATAQSLESMADLPAPYLALRDDIQNQISRVLVEQQRAMTGVRLWENVAEANRKVDELVARVKRLRDERAQTRARPDRSAVIAPLSRRFGEVLADIGYPKLSDPYLDDNLIPHVRGLPYTSASSGGLVLISVAWYLSVWEVAYEVNAKAPGLLIIDSPQKNLGHRAQVGDSDFGDFGLVENFYGHVKQWLEGPGLGAQLIVVDNSPPESVRDDVVIRFTRDPKVPPYGLITDAVD